MVPFHFVGVARKFPTAPKDSFLVANAGYLGQQTGLPAAEVVLLRTGDSPAAVAARAQPLARTIGAAVSDIGTASHTISSGLTAVDLRGLTRLELAFAVAAIVAATGLILALGLAERRQFFALLLALGARRGQLGLFIWSEGGLVLIGGAVAGTALGILVAQVLVKLLTGVFDPPPAALAVPWRYLAALVGTAILSTVGVVFSIWCLARRLAVQQLHER